MSPADPLVELILLWHYHQPDYRDPHTGAARLPWVRLHASKDYLDMAAHLARFPGVKATFNFVPSLLDQLEDAERGGGDELFQLLARSPRDLDASARREVARRCHDVPGHARARWPELKARLEETGEPDPARLLELEIWFLLAWLDPVILSEPAAAMALAAKGAWTEAHRDALLALHAGLLAQIVPAYRALADSGQAEISCSPQYHPILPLLDDVRSARRAQPDLRLPRESFAWPEDARVQLQRARASHRERFGAEALGVWPSEGSVSPETVELAASLGVRWMASDEAVLFRSLPEGQRTRAALYRPWRLETGSGEVTLFFRDHELSDRIGFVYQRWSAEDAVADFLGRLRTIAREHGGDRTPLVSVILDGENCWEAYPEDGGPFLDALYAGLSEAGDIRTVTPREVIDRADGPDLLSRLHTGSWIDADLHVWVGHPEKNRAWDLLARARRWLGGRPDAPSASRESLLRAEGSDWFWWLGDDHYTADKGVFDELFRAHLRDAYERAGETPPPTLSVPIAVPAWSAGVREPPVGFIQPVLDGRPTHYYEWHAAGRLSNLGRGGAMHSGSSSVRDLYFGFDRARLYLRLDFEADAPGGGRGLRLDLLEPTALRFEVRSLAPGPLQVEMVEGSRRTLVPGGEGRLEAVLELALPFAVMGLRPGDPVQLVLQILEEGRPVETFPSGDAVRFEAPDESFDVSAWAP